MPSIYANLKDMIFDMVAHKTCKEGKLDCEESEAPDHLEKVVDIVYIIS